MAFLEHSLIFVCYYLLLCFEKIFNEIIISKLEKNI